MFLVLKKWRLICAAGLVLLLFFFGWMLRYGQAVQTGSMNAENTAQERVWIIDAGHGGEDGGAVAADGTVESHINLSIAVKLKTIMELVGQNTVMTRVDDISIHDPGCSTLREKKVSDLKNRAKLCAETGNAVLISIHQNSLPGNTGVRGAQVFYSTSPGSYELAESIQSAINAAINTSAPKTAKKIGSDVYLLNHVTCPAVIVECGFLSNREEASLLQEESYQRQLALTVAAGALRNS